ncbi:MAG: cytosine permease [Myxococcota bacterium]
MDESEAFGDPRFTGSELLPTREDERTLATRPAIALWATLVLHPFVFDFSVSRSVLDLRGLFPALAGSALVALIGVSLLRAPQRYGLGFVATARAAFGTRGALLPLGVRWIAVVLWSAAWVNYLASWLARLLVGTLRRFSDAEFLAPYTDGVAFAAGVVLVAGAYRASSTAMELLAAQARRRLLYALTLGVTLVGLAAYQLEAAPTFASSGDGAAFSRQALALALATLPALAAFAEWARRRMRGGVDPATGRRRDRRQRVLAPFALVPTALVFSTLGALVHEAGARASGAAPRGLVASATAFGGVLGGIGAILFALVLFFALVPFAGVAAPAVGVPFGRVRARRATAVAILIVSPFVVPAPAMVSAGLLLLPVVIILVVDELVVRRGRVELEGLYRAPSRYGPILGVGIAASVSTGVGWAVLLARWDGLIYQGFPKFADLSGHLAELASGTTLEVAIVSAVASAVVFAGLRVAERFVPEWPAPRLRGPGPERIEPAPSSIHNPGEDTEWSVAIPSPIPTGPMDPTVVEEAAAVFNDAALDGADEWPDERLGDASEAKWYDGDDEVSNPSVTELGDPHFVKKQDDDA